MDLRDFDNRVMPALMLFNQFFCENILEPEDVCIGL
jgi:hypothetical protein